MEFRLTDVLLMHRSFNRRRYTFPKTPRKYIVGACVDTVDAADQSRLYRRPSCGDMSQSQACPLNYSPVCGNDGNTYPNECSLCVHRLETNADILIVKDGSC
uniref:Kazal-like domain-containing protein n=1 Tax=Oncorhynchus tshawytscha TaxID=74940 RepID=A0A8C8HUM0_ONCTS